ncbi:DUF2303 family protein [Brucella rhizosphaerae]|uniref:DUF2303 family protein n=1 Tax=Brucella rhizosphaerae TaxID=571254 RepID=A0A256FL98_9HYPH|nr:DUF2303 family protein [Brucella rhizosphaerae]OYR15623.1 hypothetical protein CEV32_4900 [Brucella rhizosphaerae]
MEDTKSIVGLNAAILTLTGLANKASDPEIISVSTKGLAKGLADEVPLAFDRNNQKFASVKNLLEEHRNAPERRRGTAHTDVLASFIDLTNRHKDDGSVIFGKASWPSPKLTSIIDYHDLDNEPRFGEHRVEYAFPVTEEFTAWVKNNAQPMEQAEFSLFLEEHSVELCAPTDGERTECERLFNEKMATPSELVMLARHLEVFVSATVKQGTRLQTGERTVEFKEEHQNAKGEPVVIPGIFMISVPAFVDGDKVRIPARLRYRIKCGDIVWFYQLYRWENVLREQVQRDLAEAAAKTGLPFFEGSAER